jgi:Ni,Fe-hydrogenase I large subunit
MQVRAMTDKPGPMEKALVVPQQDREHPVEVLRVVHAFDLCLAFMVHGDENIDIGG